ncbi:LacI family DNA-binding transcriptional regulator [Sporolactobacillus sp. KGMB 08714]|uniref:LacI family DNA-binding transcriptional regulator n=1 Tax=Sporolactobacillus sp. KGMB 08714 TaxID=3064704 RepID=UPI002FBEFAAF
MVTLKKIAKLTGVHPSTVSRTINNDPDLKIRSDTRARILKAAKELNYHPNVAARNLKKGETKTLGLVISDFYNPVIASIIHGAEIRASKEGYNLLVCGPGQNQSKTISSFIDKSYDGLLISNSCLEDSYILDLVNKKIPLVLINRKVPNMNNFVIVDDLYGAMLGVKYLAEYGHKRIAHISGPLYTTTGIERLQGYRKAIKECNIEFNSEYVQESDYSIEGGYAAMKKLLLLSQRPTAVFAASILISLGAMKAIRESGLSIPKDISLVGYHDVFFADTLNPPLTTVKMPLEEMGDQAIGKLIAMLRKKDTGKGIIVPGGSIISRESVAKI